MADATVVHASVLWDMRLPRKRPSAVGQPEEALRFIHPFIHPFSTYFLSVYSVPVSVLGSEDTAGIKTGKNIEQNGSNQTQQ